MATERDGKNLVLQEPEPGQEPADLGWDDRPLLALHHFLLSSNFICTDLGEEIRKCFSFSSIIAFLRVINEMTVGSHVSDTIKLFISLEKQVKVQ